MTDVLDGGGPEGPEQTRTDVLGDLVTKTCVRLDASYYDVRGETKTKMRSFAESVRAARGGAFLVELKPASPSKGPIRRLAPEESARLAREFASRGIAGLSVLTEPDAFGGSLESLRTTAHAVAPTPTLMKDFVISRRQIDAAKACGAAAVLLIETLFGRGATESDREALIDHAHGRGLAVLLEANSASQFRSCLDSKADVLGINNRDLGTLRMDLETTPRVLREAARDDRPVLALSGCETRADVLRMLRAGADGVLVGSSVMAARDPVAKLEELMGTRGRDGGPFVKLCGMRTERDLEAASAADAVGFVVAVPSSPRNLAAPEAARLAGSASAERVLVTSATAVDLVARTARDVHADSVQFHLEDEGRLARLRALLPSRVRLFALVALPRDAELPATFVANARKMTAHCNALFLDVRSAHGRGGTGERLDWGLARAVRDQLAPFPVILAGGLSPENVADALRAVNPAGVDVSSGIESSPGQKSPEKMRLFVQAARGAKVVA